MKTATAAVALLPLAIAAPVSTSYHTHSSTHSSKTPSCKPVTIVFSNGFSSHSSSATTSERSSIHHPDYPSAGSRDMIVQSSSLSAYPTDYDEISSGIVVADSGLGIDEMVEEAHKKCPGSEIVVLGYARNGKLRGEGGMTRDQANFINSVVVSARRIAEQMSDQSGRGSLFDD